MLVLLFLAKFNHLYLRDTSPIYYCQIRPDGEAAGEAGQAAEEGAGRIAREAGEQGKHNIKDGNKRQNMALWPYWGHKKMVKGKSKM